MTGHRQALSNATNAAYYLYGIASGLIEPDCAKEWAYKLIAELDAPPIEIIDVATANLLSEMLASLGTASEGADLALAGASLLADTHGALVSGRISLRSALQMAMKIAQSTSMPKEVYYAFDAVDDLLALAERGTYGTVADVFGYAVEEFTRYGAPGCL